jgi:hypothetical protein
MKANTHKVDPAPEKRAVSGRLSRPVLKFIGGDDASKLALVIVTVEAGDRPTAKELAGMNFVSSAARAAASALVKRAGRQGGTRTGSPRKATVGPR